MNNQQNDDMDRQTLNVAFATQKGGSGKTAITVLSTLPILCIYPFVQKFFTQGVMVGSVKG